VAPARFEVARHERGEDPPKELLQNDVSGLANTILDFAVGTAVDVDYRIETNNNNLDIILNN
jgi:hypothetical protein